MYTNLRNVTSQTSQLCKVISLQSVTQSLQPSKGKQKKKPPCFLSFIHLSRLKFQLRCLLVMKPFLFFAPTRHLPDWGALQKSRLACSCIKQFFFPVDLLFSYAQRHSSNNKPNRSVNSTLLASHSEHAYLPNLNEVSTTKQKTPSNPLTSSLSVTFLL